jgi:hypothetical protein
MPFIALRMVMKSVRIFISFSNVGIQTNMDFKKVHIFASTDNMITALSAMSAKQAAVRIGINVLF